MPAVAALVLLGGPLAVDVGLMGSASAATYPVKTSPGKVSQGSVPPGGKVTFGGGGFTAFAPIAISDTISNGRGQAAPIPDVALAGIHADASGAFSLPLTLTTPGVNTLRASGTKAGGGVTLVITAVVTVTGSRSAGSASPTASPTSSAGGGSGAGSGSGSGSGTGSLPKTGGDNIGPELWLGGGLVAVGGAALLVSVSRRRTRTQV